MNQSPLSDEEIATVTDILKKLSPGPLPFEIFHQVARLAAMPIIELVPVRRRNGKTEVLLLRREADDPIWPNELHTPGTVVRGNDEGSDFTSAFDRICNQEMSNAAITKPVFVKHLFRRGSRGAEAAAIYWAECLEEVPGGVFYPIDAMPPDLVQEQLPFIMLAVQAFEDQLTDVR